jgi:hypothetical protein
MATFAFTRIGSTVKVVKDSTIISYKPTIMVASVDGTTITYKCPDIRYQFSFSSSDTITADGDSVSGTADEIVEALGEAIF